MGLALQEIDDLRVKEIVKNFLEQYHSGITIESVKLEDGVWTADATVFSPGKLNKQIRIDSKTGGILSWSNYSQIPQEKKPKQELEPNLEDLWIGV